ncbi:unnamed protein product [Rotaria magnacalcarata]|uniref:NAD(P)(+)--arginine ADP-ribosyltransferase n=1 Tax=Rotaria magnacalcarata TaxID=392030 RepID=A0A820G0W7_9BILA|nr:unnamed protein product [Rotaria magnacalcarata]CAF4269394.1 unnamed protein product [Rotaria magnacalcarata]
MATSVRNVDRFSCVTSRFLLPTFRRPSYREIIRLDVECDPADEVFFRWTKEEGQYYSLISTALLDDDYEVLKNNAKFINSLRTAIRNNNQNESLKVYRGLSLTSENVKQEYKEGLQFLWPTFACTSRNKDVAHGFGNYMFEIEASEDDWTYRTDISQYSEFPEEQEVLFYPYSGYTVKNIMHDAKIIQLKCIDTLDVELIGQTLVPNKVKISDPSRNMFVHFHKDSADVHCSYADNSDEMFLITENGNGYWDAPYRYHHRNGYFIDKGNDLWEEYHDNKFFAKFTRIYEDDD